MTAERTRSRELEPDVQEMSARVVALEADLAIARRERDALRAELTACRQERDGLMLRLLDTEADLAAKTAEQGEWRAALAAATRRAVEAECRATELARELAAIRQTVSWRVTRPLRAVRSRTLRP